MFFLDRYKQLTHYGFSILLCLMLSIPTVAMGGQPSEPLPTETQLNIIYNQLRGIQQNITLGNIHFRHYLTTDLSRAKAIYAYGYASSSQSEALLKQAETLTSKASDISADSMDRLSDILIMSESISTYIDEWDAEILRFVSSVAAIQARAHRVDIRSPMSDLIHGKLDSDNDGIGDHIQLP